MAVEWGLAEEIFSVTVYFFALTPVFSVGFFYNIHSSLKYGILSQSTAVFPQSVENVVNTQSCMKNINTVMPTQKNQYNLEKYRDIHFWSYRPELLATHFLRLFNPGFENH